MSEPFIGEIRAFPYNFTPAGWMTCNGGLLPVSQYTALFAIIGTTYGGDGRTTFALPNLNGASKQEMMPMMGAGHGPGLSDYSLGQQSGAGSVSLVEAQLPAHTHSVTGILAKSTDTYSEPLDQQSHLSRLFVSGSGDPAYSDQPLTPSAILASETLSPPVAAQGLPHDNHQPFLSFLYAIAWEGVFPARN